jgi:hypothetical protein
MSRAVNVKGERRDKRDQRADQQKGRQDES